MTEEGYENGAKCNRDGCEGVIEQHDTDGCCSCHIHPPCGYCTTPREYCPVCEWDAEDEQREVEQAHVRSVMDNPELRERYERESAEREKSDRLFWEAYRGNNAVTEPMLRHKSHTHFSQKWFCVHPAGYDLTEIMKTVRGTFGGRFASKSDTTFEYIAYTD